MSAVTEVFGRSCSRKCSSDSDEGGLIRRGCNNDGAFQSFPTQVVFNEFTYLASTLTDERDHSQQAALADTAAAENSDSLAQTAGKQTVNGANAGLQGLANGVAEQWVCRIGVEILPVQQERQRSIVDRPS